MTVFVKETGEKVIPLHNGPKVRIIGATTERRDDMLTLLTGVDRTALSGQLVDELVRRAAEMPGQILLVPEQFSHEAERILLEAGGNTISRYAEVLSLSRLSDRVAAAHGGAARAYLDKGGRLLAMALAAEQVASRIRLYAAVLRRPDF